MHELSIAGAVLATSVRAAEGRPVELVAMRVGALRQVVSDSLRFYWEIVARDSLCEGAQLELLEVQARLRCGACAHEWGPETPAFRCPACAAADVAIVAGNELEVDYIEVREPAHA